MTPEQTLERVDGHVAEHVAETSDYVCPLCDGVAAYPGKEMHMGCEFALLYKTLEDFERLKELVSRADFQCSLGDAIEMAHICKESEDTNG